MLSHCFTTLSAKNICSFNFWIPAGHPKIFEHRKFFWFTVHTYTCTYTHVDLKFLVTTIFGARKGEVIVLRSPSFPWRHISPRATYFFPVPEPTIKARFWQEKRRQGTAFPRAKLEPPKSRTNMTGLSRSLSIKLLPRHTYHIASHQSVCVQHTIHKTHHSQNTSFTEHILCFLCHALSIFKPRAQ